MTPVLLFGWAAAFVGTVLGVPQVVRLVRTRSVEGLSLAAWQVILGLNIGWLVHGFLIHQLNMILPNGLGMIVTLTILRLMAREERRPLLRTLLPGVLIGVVMIAVDVVFGSATYGAFAVIPAIFANIGQSIELVRAPRVTGVSPAFLVGAVLNQALWLAWGLLVPDPGTIIAATVTGAITLFNLVWWGLRKAGLRPLQLGAVSRVEVWLSRRSSASGTIAAPIGLAGAPDPIDDPETAEPGLVVPGVVAEVAPDAD